MPLQNRVTPLSELIADPARGLVYGNRGCLHDASGQIRRRYAGKRWIACRLRFRGWHRAPLLQPGRFTELFFLDEATAFAAGHRPCALCRREDYERFGAIWRDSHPGDAGADAIDARLHAERVDLATRAQRRHVALPDELHDGAFVMHDGAPHVVLGARLLRWTPTGYDEPAPRPAGGEAQLLRQTRAEHVQPALRRTDAEAELLLRTPASRVQGAPRRTGARAELLTPPSLLAVLRAGWEPAVPLLHPSAS